ncbi:MAG: xylose isomerase [Phycisphaeraceae bacterium]|nr:xylose isomerase [Phycisphaeraceae bacterium]
MKLGVNSILFGGHDMAVAFEYTAASGYDGIELSAIEGFGDRHLVLGEWRQIVPTINELSKKWNLPVTAIEQPSQEPDRMEAVFEAAAEIDCPVINCGPGGETGSEASLQEVIDTLGRLSERAAHFGRTLCVKAHVGMAVHDTPTSLRVLDAITSDAFGLDMDPSHVHRAGENPVEALAAVIDRVRHVHIRDCRGRQTGPGDPEMQANGRGDIDLLGYMRVLHEHRYTGPVNLEIIGAQEYALPRCVAIAAESRGHMQACLQACGAR